MIFLKASHSHDWLIAHTAMPLGTRQHSAQPTHPSPSPLAAAAQCRLRACAGKIRGVPHTVFILMQVTHHRCGFFAIARALFWPENPQHILFCDLGACVLPYTPQLLWKMAMWLSELDFLCNVAIASNLILFLLLATNAVLILPFLFIASLVYLSLTVYSLSPGSLF